MTTEPRTFKDNRGDLWTVVVDYPTARRVRDQLGFKLLEVSEANLLRLADEVLLVDVLFLCCESQARGREITDREFGERLCRGPIDDAQRALLRAVADFTPPGKQAVLQRVLDRVMAADDEGIGRLEQAIESGELDEMLDRVLPIGSAADPRTPTPLPGTAAGDSRAS